MSRTLGRWPLRLAVFGLAGSFGGCGDEVAPPVEDCSPFCPVEPGPRTVDPRHAVLPYGRTLVTFEPGPGAGFGQEDLPDIVLGPPRGAGELGGSLDVVSLGMGGFIVLGFGDWMATDGPGADLVVFENPFFMGGDPTLPFGELAEVSVSTDAVHWRTFDCDLKPDSPGRWPGCAGWQPVLSFDPLVVDPLQPEVSGGDAFDLETVGLKTARYVRIRDLSEEAISPTAGFDLDAVGLVHAVRTP